jgi:hypothetical protein
MIPFSAPAQICRLRHSSRYRALSADKEMIRHPQTTRVIKAIRRRLQPRCDSIIVFNHIPKTAGMSFHRFIEMNVPKDSVAQFYTINNRDRLVNLTSKEQMFLWAIVGHLPFSYFSTAQLEKSTVHVTVLRDPVERIVSFYHYIRRNQEHYLHAKLVNENLSLTDFVQQKLTLECDNLQVRYLCSSDLSGIPIGSCTRDMLAEAMSNVENSFAVVGLKERFDDTLTLMARTFDWKVPRKKIRINYSGDDRAVHDIDKSTRNAIAKINHLDEELYHCARDLFHRRMAKLS